MLIYKYNKKRLAAEKENPRLSDKLKQGNITIKEHEIKNMLIQAKDKLNKTLNDCQRTPRSLYA